MDFFEFLGEDILMGAENRHNFLYRGRTERDQ
jgi:hypothetical protein